MAKSENLHRKAYALDTNVLIHDPTATLNFEENHVIIPMTVLEELDKLKDSGKTIAADWERGQVCSVSVAFPLDVTTSFQSVVPPKKVPQGIDVLLKSQWTAAPPGCAKPVALHFRIVLPLASLVITVLVSVVKANAPLPSNKPQPKFVMMIAGAA